MAKTPSGKTSGPSAHGYSGKPLAAKLGFKTGMTVAMVGAPQHYGDLVAERPDGVKLRRATIAKLAPATADIVHLFVKTRSELEAQAPIALAALVAGGMLWVSWPKKSSALHRDLKIGRAHV